MRYLVIILLFFFSFDGIAQPISYRSNNQITVFDYNLFTGNSFRVPIYQDTIAANAAYTLDSCGKIIFTYTGNLLWYRACNPKRWLQVGSGSITRAVDTIYRTPGKDSIYYKISGITYRIKDSIGGGSSTPNLQQVTNIGDTTTNNIYVNKLGVYDGANDLYNWIEGGDQSISFYNGYDSTHMAQIQKGVIASFDTNNIQGSINFNGITAIREYKTPDTSGILTLSVNGKFADTKGNIDIDTAGTQNLQQVTDIGNTTTNTIDVYNGGVINVWNDTVGGVLSTALYEDATIYTRRNVTFGDDGFSNYTSTLSALDSFTNYRNIYLPDTSGTIALSVNGYTANNKGQITIPVGTGTVTGTGTATRVAFWGTGSSISSDSSLYWDSTSKRLGVGTTTPISPLSVNGATRLDGATTLGETPDGGGFYNSFNLYFNGKGTSGVAQSASINLDGYGAAGQEMLQLTSNGGIRLTSASAALEIPSDVYNNTTAGLKVRATSTTNGMIVGNNYSQASGSLFNVVNSGSISKLSIDAATDSVTISNLSGSGTRMVTANSSGILSTQTIPSGTVTGVTATSPITSSAGTAPVISTSMATNKLIGRYSAGTGVMEEVTIGSGLTLTGAGNLNNTATPTPLGYYGAFQDTISQTAAVINTGYPMKLRVTDLSNQITVVSDSRVTIANTGVYNIQWSAQFTNPLAAEHDVTIWLRKNGVDVPGSAGIVLVPAKHGAFDGHTLPSWNFLLDAVAGDYYEFVWSTVNTSVYISYNPAGNPPPSSASVVLTVTQQSGIMAGTGITAINSLTGATQTMVTGTDSSDFKIVSSGTTHKFNLPTASATKRGALSSADWTTFNSKVGGSGTIGAIPKYTGTSTLGDATADVDYLQQDMSLVAMQSMGSSIKCYNIGAPIPTALSATSNMGTGSLYLVAVYIPKAVTITGVRWFQTVNGANVANNYNGVALYSVSGGTLTLVDSSTRDGNVWKQGVDWQSKAFVTPYSASRGIYYIGALMSYSSTTTAPSIAYNGSTSATYSATSSFDFTNSQKIAGTLTSQTIVPSTITLSSLPSVAYKFGLYLY